MIDIDAISARCKAARKNKPDSVGTDAILTDMETLLAEIEQLTKERDAAVGDMPHNARLCKNRAEDCGTRNHDYCAGCFNWQWRGLKESI